MADTRKDKRAPLSLKVRFKSATLDEFLTQYSGDVSRGGLFIKSKTPMSVGTLLKFELQLKDESRLIHGVGRVVWKRDASEGTSDRPAGMGIKFIKMDPESRILVDRIVDRRGDEPGRFEHGAEPPRAETPFFPTDGPAQLPPPEDRTQIRHASEFLASVFGEGGAEGAASAGASTSDRAEAGGAMTAGEEAALGAGVRSASGSAQPFGALDSLLPPSTSMAPGPALPTLFPSELPAPGGSAPPSLEPPSVASPPVGDGRSAPSGAPFPDLGSQPVELVRPAARTPAQPSVTAEPATRRRSSEPSNDASRDAIGRADTLDAPIAAALAVELAAAAREVAAGQPGESAVHPASETASPTPTGAVDATRAEPSTLRVDPPAPARGVVRPLTPAEAVERAPADKRSHPLPIVLAVAAAAAAGFFIFRPPSALLGETEAEARGSATPTGGAGQDTLPNERGALPQAAASPEVALVPPTAEGAAVADAGSAEGVAPAAGDTAAVTPVALETTPSGASVMVDGRSRGTTPLSLDVELGSEVEVVFDAEGFASRTERVRLTAPRSAPLRFVLTPLPWVLLVESEPEGARVTAAGTTLRAPGEVTLRTPPRAQLSVAASKPGFAPGRETVEAAAFHEENGRMVARVKVGLRALGDTRREPGSSQAAVGSAASAASTPPAARGSGAADAPRGESSAVESAGREPGPSAADPAPSREAAPEGEASAPEAPVEAPVEPSNPPQESPEAAPTPTPPANAPPRGEAPAAPPVRPVAPPGPSAGQSGTSPSP